MNTDQHTVQRPMYVVEKINAVIIINNHTWRTTIVDRPCEEHVLIGFEPDAP